MRVMATTVEGVKLVTLSIDGRPVTVPEGTTIWEAALEAGIDIPALCHDPRYEPVGVCRMCVRCVRACDDIQSNEVIGRTGKGYTARIGFDLDDPMGSSTCVTCGECVAACPTGAIVNKPITLPLRPRSQLRQVDSVCPYCGV